MILYKFDYELVTLFKKIKSQTANKLSKESENYVWMSKARKLYCAKFKKQRKFSPK